MDKYLELKNTIEDIAKGVMESRTSTKKVHAKLISVTPLKFQLNEKIFIYGSALISPKYRVFREDEIGNEFVFQEDESGQQYIYCYEAASPGENGVPYKWKGKIRCNIRGTCSHGAVVVTEGELIEVIHERGLK